MKSASISRNSVLLILIVAVVLRLTFLAVVSQDKSNWHTMDSVIYISIAKGIVDTGTYSRLKDDQSEYISETERVPLYSGYLAAFLLASGENYLWPLLGQIVMGALTCILIGLLTEELHRGGFLVGGILAALNLNLISHTAVILSDTLFLLFFCLHLWFSVRLIQSTMWRHALLAGFFLGLALMTRPFVLYWVPVYALYIFWIVRKAGYNAAIKQAVLAIAIPLLLASPLYIRNYSQYDHIALVSQGGTAALNWYVPLAREFNTGETWGQGVKIMSVRLDEYVRERHLDEEMHNPFGASKIQIALAKEEMLKLGVFGIANAWVSGAAINLFTPSVASVNILDKMDRPRFYYTEGRNLIVKTWNFLTHPDNRLYLAIIFPGIIITILFKGMLVIGVTKLIKMPGSDVHVLLFYSMVIGFVLAITGPVVNAARYRLPMEPVLTVFTAVGIITFYQWWADRRRGGCDMEQVL